MAITILKQKYLIRVFLFSNSPFIYYIYRRRDDAALRVSEYLEVTGRGVLQASSYVFGKTIKPLEKYELEQPVDQRSFVTGYL